MWRTVGPACSNASRKVFPSLLLAGSSAASTVAVPAPVVRGFAGKAPAQQQDDISIPVPMYGVTGKYASALYVTAVRGQMLEPVEVELKNIIAASHQNDSFCEFLKDPSVSRDVRMKAIQEIFGKDMSYSDITKNFLAVLAENGRLREIYKISSAYSELVLAHKGEVKATITAALELTAEELQGITESLSGHIKPGQILKVEQKVDRSIVGGIVIDILDKHIDLSISTRIKQMEKVLAANF